MKNVSKQAQRKAVKLQKCREKKNAKRKLKNGKNKRGDRMAIDTSYATRVVMSRVAGAKWILGFLSKGTKVKNDAATQTILGARTQLF